MPEYKFKIYLRNNVDEVIINAGVQNYQENDEIVFSSVTAHSKVAVVTRFAPESNSTDIHVELESNTISNSQIQRFIT